MVRVIYEEEGFGVAQSADCNRMPIVEIEGKGWKPDQAAYVVIICL